MRVMRVWISIHERANDGFGLGMEDFATNLDADVETNGTEIRNIKLCVQPIC